jgi:hypothetical protein
VRVGALDPRLPAVSGWPRSLSCVIGWGETLDEAVRSIKQRDRGFGAGELLVGLANTNLVRPPGYKHANTKIDSAHSSRNRV